MDELDEARQLLADYSGSRAFFAEEREKAARDLVNDLKAIEGFGWKTHVFPDGLSASITCDHAPAGSEAVLKYDTTSSPPEWTLKCKDGRTGD